MATPIEKTGEILDKRYRPTFTALLGLGVFAMVVLTGFILLSDFSKARAREVMEPTAQVVANEREHVGKLEERLRVLEEGQIRIETKQDLLLQHFGLTQGK